VYNLRTFAFAEMMDCRSRLRSLFAEREPETIGEAARLVVDFLYSSFVDDEGRPACALVRLFKTHLYADLPDELQLFARSVAPEAATLPDVRCLALLATQGDEPEWRSRHLSRGHKAIPLISEAMVAGAPMIAQLIQQLGLRVAHVVRPDPALLLDTNERSHNVFHVARAKGSPYIVAQAEFVERYGIESVIGFGGMVATGDLFAAIMFSKVPIATAVADQFKVIGLNLKMALLPVARKPLF
jgi:hypothetical protein